jgi:hypothetical protein
MILQCNSEKCILKYIIMNINRLFLLWLFADSVIFQLFRHHIDEVVNYDYTLNNCNAEYAKCTFRDFHFPIFSNQPHSGKIQKQYIAFEIQILINLSHL